MNLARRYWLLLCAGGLLVIGAWPRTAPPARMDFRLTSTAFANNQPIPRAHSCDGDNTSPVLRWQGTPSGARSLALILHDPDAPSGEFIHWVLYDLPATITELPSGKYQNARFPLGGLQGKNGFGGLGYGGPCPPPGAPHHYVFTLYALSQPSLGIAAGASKEELDAAMSGKVLAQAQLVGLYSRQAR